MRILVIITEVPIDEDRTILCPLRNDRDRLDLLNIVLFIGFESVDSVGLCFLGRSRAMESHGLRISTFDVVVLIVLLALLVLLILILSLELGIFLCCNSR